MTAGLPEKTKILFLTEHYPGGRQKSVNSRERLLSGFFKDSLFLAPESDALGAEFYFKKSVCGHKFPFDIYLIRLSLGNFIDFIYKVQKFVFLGKKILSAHKEITSIVGISDTGPAMVSAFLLSASSGRPYSLIMFDLWRDNFLRPVDKMLAIIFEGIIMRRAKTVVSIGYGIAEILKKRYGIDTEVIYHSVDIPSEKPVPRKTGRPVKILYSGSVYWPQVEPLSSLVKVVDSMHDVRLDIYSFQRPDEFKKLGLIGKSVNFYSPVSNKEMLEIQRNYDILFLPLFSSGKGKYEILAAHPGKLPEYLVSGVPILACAPKNSFLANYAIGNKFALVVNRNDLESLKEAVGKLISDNNLREMLVDNAWTTANKMHDVRINSRILRGSLANNS